METLRIIIAVLHRAYEETIEFLEECRKVLEELLPLAGQIAALGLVPFALFIWLLYELGENVHPGIGIVIASIVAVLSIILFARETLKHKAKITDSGWSLKKVLLVVVVNSFLLLMAVAIHMANVSARERLAIQRLSESRTQTSMDRANQETTNKNVQMSRTENKNTRGGIETANSNVAPREETIPDPEPPPISPLDSPTELWTFIAHSYPSQKERNKQGKILKFVRWDSLVLTSQEDSPSDSDILILELHENNSRFDEDKSIPTVVCHLSISKLKAATLKKLRELDATETNYLQVSGIITDIITTEGRPKIVLGTKTSIAFMSTSPFRG